MFIMEALYIIAFFAAVLVIVLVVGFIGNKVMDGAHNAWTRHKAENRRIDPRDEAVTESLASRYDQLPQTLEDPFSRRQ
jgi:hypothetical protein